jgi:hypothetical protein
MAGAAAGIAGLTSGIVLGDAGQAQATTAASGEDPTTVVWLAPSGDVTGETDAQNIGALSDGCAVYLAPGTYYVSGTITAPAGAVFDLGGASIEPGSSWSGSGSLVQLTGNGTIVRNGALINAPADAVSVVAGINDWWLYNLVINSAGGWAIAVVPSGSTHGTIKSIKGSGNYAGISIVPSTASTVTAEVCLVDVNLQATTTSPCLQLQYVTDIQVLGLNASMQNAAGNPCVLVADGCETVFMTNIDIGGPADGTVPCLEVAAISACSAPAVCDFAGGTVQDGGIGVLVNGSRLRFRGIMAKRSQFDGWRISGSGTANLLEGCAGNLNNQASGTAYDVNVTGTAHVGIFSFAYVSAGVTDALMVPATNNVTNANATYPGGKNVLGTPGGW